MSRRACISFVFVVPLCFAEPVTLNLSSAETSANATVSLQCSFSASLSAPTSLQWTLQGPPALDIVGVEGTKALSEAGKSLVCKNGKCIVYGLNRTAIPNGPIAIVRIKVGKNTSGKRLCCKNNSVGETEPTANLVGRLWSFQSEDFPDKLNLPKDIPFRQPPHLAFPDHV